MITGEYPPQKGGVADYTEIVSHNLTMSGDNVEVWAPWSTKFPVRDAAQLVHRVKGSFDCRDLVTIDRALNKQKPDRVLIQYVPGAFGFKGMNLPFCLWAMKARRDYHIWVMFHEVAFPARPNQPLRHKILSVVNRTMAKLLTYSAERIFVSTPSWNVILKSISPSTVQPEWLPIPSNVRRCSDQCDNGSLRKRYAVSDQILVGHFGTYGSHISKMLSVLIPEVLRTSLKIAFMLLGDGSRGFSEQIARDNPALESRIHSVGFLPDHELSHHIAACDLMLQPYADGVSSRRTTVMASLAHGRPVVTTTGALTEPIWTQSKAVAIASADEPEMLSRLVVSLAANDDERRRLSQAGYSLYRERFDVRHTIDVLRGGAKR